MRTDPGFASAAAAGVSSSPPALGSQTGSFYLYDYVIKNRKTHTHTHNTEEISDFTPSCRTELNFAHLPAKRSHLTIPAAIAVMIN